MALLVGILIAGCGKNRQASWPAYVAGYQNFTTDQQNAISSAVTKLNLHENLSMVGSSNGTGQYPIYFRLVDPSGASPNRAGLATVEDDKCTIDISKEIFDPDHTDYLEPVVWHELGHCAGLQHVSGQGEIMYYTSSPLPDYREDALSRFFQQFRSAAGL